MIENLKKRCVNKFIQGECKILVGIVIKKETFNYTTHTVGLRGFPFQIDGNTPKKESSWRINDLPFPISGEHSPLSFSDAH